MPKTEDLVSTHRSFDSAPSDASSLESSDKEKGILYERTAEGQASRLRLLDGANIVFFSAGYPGKRHIYEQAYDLGCNVVIIEESGSWVSALQNEGIIAKFIPLNFRQMHENEIMEKSLVLLRSIDWNDIEQFGAKRMNKKNGLYKAPNTTKDFPDSFSGYLKKGIIHGILTMDEFSTHTVSRLSQVLGLPGHPPEAIRNARDKMRTRQILKVSGITCIRYTSLNTLQDRMDVSSSSSLNMTACRNGIYKDNVGELFDSSLEETTWGGDSREGVDEGEDFRTPMSDSHPESRYENGLSCNSHQSLNHHPPFHIQSQLPVGYDKFQGLKKHADQNTINGHFSPYCDLTDGLERLRNAAIEVGFPAVLKPTIGGGSFGVRKVNSLTELVSAYIENIEYMKTLNITDGNICQTVNIETKGENLKTDTDVNEQDRVTSIGVFGIKQVMQYPSNTSTLVHTLAPVETLADCPTSPYGFSSDLMLEEYINGQEVDIDLILYKGRVSYSGVHDNGPTSEPWFNETYDIYPSMLSSEDQDRLTDLAQKTCLALGFETGIFHVEAKISNSTPLIIEVNARMGGGIVRIINKLAVGVDLVSECLLSAVGLPTLPPIRRKVTPVSASSVNAIRSGKLMSISFAEKFRSYPGIDVRLYEIHVSEGEHIVGPEHGQPTWLTDIVFTANTPCEALELSIRVNKEIAEEFASHCESLVPQVLY